MKGEAQPLHKRQWWAKPCLIGTQMGRSESKSCARGWGLFKWQRSDLTIRLLSFPIWAPLNLSGWSSSAPYKKCSIVKWGLLSEGCIYPDWLTDGLHWEETSARNDQARKDCPRAMLNTESWKAQEEKPRLMWRECLRRGHCMLRMRIKGKRSREKPWILWVDEVVPGKTSWLKYDGKIEGDVWS